MSIIPAIANCNRPLLAISYAPAMAGLDIERMHSAMRDAGFDQATLAKKVNCTQGAISQILIGKTQRSKFMPDIASALGVSLSWLRGETDDPHATRPSVGADFPSESSLLAVLRLLGPILGQAPESEAVLQARARIWRGILRFLARHPAIADDPAQLEGALRAIVDEHSGPVPPLLS